MKIPILTDGPAIGDFVSRFSKRLAGTNAGLSEKVAERTEKIFGKRLSPLEVVRRIVSDVETRGDEAVAEYTRKIDGVDLSPSDFRVNEKDIDKGSSDLPKDLAKAIEDAGESIARFQERIDPGSRTTDAGSDTGRITMNVVSLSSAGINVPAGEAPHPSTVLMCAVPASVAGVERIAVVTPPGTYETPARFSLETTHRRRWATTAPGRPTCFQREGPPASSPVFRCTTSTAGSP